MPRPGRRYPLLLYTRMLDLWWPLVMVLGFGLLALAWGLSSYFPDLTDAWRWMTLAAVGGVVLLFSLFLLAMRKSGYVQLFRDHLRLVTPFLRLNVSYKRVVRTSSATMGGLFESAGLKGWKRELLVPLARKTAVVVDLNGYPASQSALRMFLSPFFFRDKTPHFVLLVEDWMRFSAELESLRTGGGGEPAPKRKVDRSILTRLPHK